MPKKRNIRIKPIQAAGDFLRFGSGGAVVVAETTLANK
jgi:hypothetical protein